MSNLLKASCAITKDERVIDYNEIIRAKLQTIMQSPNRVDADPDGFVSGLTAGVVEELIMDEQTDGENASQQAAVTIEQMSEQAEQIIRDAETEAENIKADAEAQAEQIIEQSKEEGYKAGIDMASQELSTRQQQLEQEFAAKQRKLEEEYNTLRNNLEPQLVEVITDIFSKIILDAKQDDKSILIHLINSTLADVPKSDEFLIKVSSQDYQYVLDNQGKIFCALSKEAIIDVIEDSSMAQGECIIENADAVYDCSIDVELENIIKKIKMLSWG